MTAEFSLPSERALLAATLALMSAYAQPVAAGMGGAAQQRVLVARKVVVNLGLLLDHPALDEAMRGVVRQVHRHWRAITAQSETACPAGTGPTSPWTH